MAITSLSEVQNDYGSYRGNSLVGELGGIGSVPNNGLENIVGKPYPFLNGIILNIGGVLYTDSGYLNALKAAGNPYISKRSLPTVPLQLSDLTELVPDVKVYDLETTGSDSTEPVSDEGGPVYRTQYAEANVTKRMSTVDDILKYLNDFLNPNTTDTVLTASTIGSWEIKTSTYSSELDVNGLYPGLEFETYEDIASPSSVTKPSTPPTETEPKQPEPVIIAEVPREPEIKIIPFIPEPTEPISIIPPLDLSPINIGTGGTSGGSRFFRDRVRFDEPGSGRFLNGGFDGQDTLRVSDEMEGFLF